jgi:hypothetical protein
MAHVEHTDVWVGKGGMARRALRPIGLVTLILVVYFLVPSLIRPSAESM